DLKAQGLGGIKFHQLFYNNASTCPEQVSKRQILARHPNFDPKHPRTGGFVCTKDEAPEPRSQLVYDKNDIDWDKWSDYSQAEVFTPYRGWFVAITPVLDVNQNENIITVRPLRSSVQKMDRYFIQNVLDALDSPGEWFLDYKTDELYFYPPDGDIKNSLVTIPVIDNIIEFKGTIPYPHKYLSIAYRAKPEDCPVNDVKMNAVSHITLKGFTIEQARQDAIRMTGTKSCQVISCRITNVGGVGVNIGGVTSTYEEIGNPRVTPATGYEKIGAGAGGQLLWSNDPGMKCKVIGCDIWDVGCEGIMLLGDDNLALNNHIYDIGLYAKDAPGINLLGARNIARRNTIHDMPRCAIFFKGVDNIMELNDVHHVILETKDMGAIRSVHRNRYLGGDIIRHNRIFDVPGYGLAGGRFQSPIFFTFGIYLDDYTCNVKSYGNIIGNIGRSGIMTHGGGDNSFVNNIVYNVAGFPVEYSPINPKNKGKEHRDSHFEHIFINNIATNNILVSATNNILVSAENYTVPYRFARVEPWGKHRVYFANNVIYNKNITDNPAAVIVSNHEALTWKQWKQFGMEDGSIVADPLFVDVTDRNFKLKKDSPAWALGFKEIPVDKIGCYKSPQRVSWPIEPNMDRFREEPVLYQPADYKLKPADSFKVNIIDIADVNKTGW
ncbi:MAG: right-handed parallel beta-helix repeat-containing protein, partial [Planctomycetota bacterium]